MTSPPKDAIIASLVITPTEGNGSEPQAYDASLANRGDIETLRIIEAPE